MAILYKYVPPCIGCKSIPEVGDGTLRATQPAALNDPFECSVKTLYNFQNEEEENRYVADALTRLNKNNLVTEEDVQGARKKFGSQFTHQLVEEQVSTRFGIVSFTTDPCNRLMWSHYATGGTGFVIGYDKAEICELAGPEIRLQEVIYDDRLPPVVGLEVLVPPESNLPKLLSVKSKEWSYENEWRLIVDLCRTIETGKTDPLEQPINLLRIPNEAVVRVYYTDRTPSKAVESITNRLADPSNRYGAGTPRRLVLSSESYGYEEVPDDCSAQEQ